MKNIKPITQSAGLIVIVTLVVAAINYFISVNSSLSSIASPYILSSLLIIFLGVVFLVLIIIRFKYISNIIKYLGDEIDSEERIAIKSITGSAEIGELADAISSFIKQQEDKQNELKDENLNYFANNKVLKYKTGNLEAVLNELPDGVLILDESGAVTFVNRMLESLLCVDSDLISKKVHEFSKDDELTDFLAKYQGKGRLRRSEKIEFSPSDDPSKTIMVSANPLTPKDESHTQLGTLIIVRDITAEVLARKSRGEFVSHVSHELKSPLNVLKMYSEMLLDQGADNKDFRVEAVNTIYDEVDRLETLINNLLSISKIEMGSIALDRHRVKPVEFLEDTFKTICRTGKESDLSYNLDLPHDMSPISIDKDLFNVALNNLLTNAIKYNIDGGSVSMTAKETDDLISITVKDTGLGISEEDQDKIFDKFFRSDSTEVRDRSGHGVGLSLAKSIIEIHHGRLLLNSVLGEGTEFIVELDKGEGLISEGI